MQLTTATIDDLRNVCRWVTSKNACLRWAGPAVFYPVDDELIARQTDFTTENSFVLRSSESIIGFGQIIGIGDKHCHFARLTVAPDHRGNGFGQILCNKLLQTAMDNGATSVSLKVFADNEIALGLYQKLGFEPVETVSTEEVLYMQRALSNRPER